MNNRIISRPDRNEIETIAMDFLVWMNLSIRLNHIDDRKRPPIDLDVERDRLNVEGFLKRIVFCSIVEDKIQMIQWFVLLREHNSNVLR